MRITENPCYDEATKTDCPSRRAGCSAECEKWAEYKAKMLEKYAEAKKNDKYASNRATRKFQRLRREIALRTTGRCK